MSAITTEGLKTSLNDSSSIDEIVSNFAEIVREQQKQIDQLKDELQQTRREAAEDRKRLTELEEAREPDSIDDNPKGSDVEESAPDADSSLEDVIRLPEHVAEDSLSKNQERARFVAKDIVDYSTSVPAGRVIRSSEIRRVLRAGEDSTIHTETVSRVMDFLDRLGEDDVRIKESQSGERVVVFEDDLVKRIVAFSNHGVVTDRGAKGGVRT